MKADDVTKIENLMRTTSEETKSHEKVGKADDSERGERKASEIINNQISNFIYKGEVEDDDDDKAERKTTITITEGYDEVEGRQGSGLLGPFTSNLVSSPLSPKKVDDGGNNHERKVEVLDQTSDAANGDSGREGGSGGGRIISNISSNFFQINEDDEVKDKDKGNEEEEEEERVKETVKKDDKQVKIEEEEEEEEGGGCVIDNIVCHLLISFPRTLV